MSTRATYRIKEFGGIEPYIEYFYIHYDGYPEGAACYFKQLLKNYEFLKEERIKGHSHWRPGKAIIAFGMIPLSELTRDHEEHGDTEYRYNIYLDKKNNSWSLRAYNDESCFFDDDLIKFIEKYGEINEKN